MHFPTWVDLKGQDAVPETVHHVLCYVDTLADTAWRNLQHEIKVREQNQLTSPIFKGLYCFKTVASFPGQAFLSHFSLRCS